MQRLIKRYGRFSLYTASALCFGFPAWAEQKNDAVTQRGATQKNVAQEKRLERISIHEKRRVVGGGLMKTQTAPRAISEVTQDYIAKQAPTLSPTSLIASLPGVQAGNESPLSTQAETLHIRGLDQTQIGFVFEGIPAADVFSYAPWNAAMVDNENLASISVTQGSIDLASPLYNADGAQVTMKALRPADKAGGTLSLGGGTHSLQKGFLRLNTGEIGHSDVRAYASFSHSSANLWRGPGDVSRYHVDANLEKRWSKGNVSDVIFGYNQGRQTIYRYPNLAQWQQYGTSFNYTAPYTPGGYAYYKLNERFTNVAFGTIRNDFRLGDHWFLHVTPYGISQMGPNNYGMAVPTANGYIGTQRYDYLDGYQGQNRTLLVQSVHPWEQRSSGVTASLDWKTRHNTITFFYFYSYADHQERQDRFVVGDDGSVTWKNPLTANGRLVTGYDISQTQQLNALGFDDKLSLWGDRLTLDAGFKATMVSRMTSQGVPGAIPFKVAPNNFIPTPQFLASYRITSKDQVYMNASTAYRLPAGYSAYVPSFGNTSPNPTSIPPNNLQPEYFIGEELGYRHNARVSVSIAGFHYNLTNHQISSLAYQPGSTILVSSQIAAGGEEAWGIQAELATRPWHHLSAYLSGQYLHTRLGNNVSTGNDHVPTTGKSAPGAPKYTGAIGLTFDDSVWFGNFNLRYQDSQFSTLMNDQSIPAFVTADLSMGRKLPSFGTRVHPRAMLSLTNLGGANYLSGLGGFGITAQPRTGIFGNKVGASSPVFVVGSAFTAMATLAADF
ncbi:TonB-dependent receptor [Asaia krungthepensis]|uniref:TonB-dependent receptor n=1 Tax=Asaia krungthepensis NRIC 0535 TaxID=1307925 RepID=A0ABQ0Q0X5_9PROT|nr:TonB-dependent receptor plug domain-containing protein [Asaia krungthepensis]GBQ86457.1 TonB-dependent receptor [Asaia krungthepensis NRIC 0535]